VTLVIVLAIIIGLAVVAVAFLASRRRRSRLNPVLRVGNKLPAFTAETEDGEIVEHESLRGKPAVIVFLRGSWCPFCNNQVKNLTGHYRKINDMGASLLFITARPLQTTSRVAKVFGVDFTFWLDPDLKIARLLGILSPEGVPDEIRDKFGQDTVWPTALVLDAGGTIRYANQSSDVRARPDPAVFVRELQKLGR